MTAQRGLDVAGVRPVVTPTSARQRQRHRRILNAARHHAARSGFDGMQMHDVARDAEVAIGTLYRYFPSKVQLLLGVSLDNMQSSQQELVRPPGPADVAVGSFLIEMCEEMCREPLLSSAILHASVVGGAEEPSRETDRIFSDMLLSVAGVRLPDEQDQRVVRLMVRCWYGVLVTLLNGNTSMGEATEEIRLFCTALLAHLSSTPDGPDEDER